MTSPERPRWRSPATVLQLGQTLAVIGAVVLVVGLLLKGGSTSVTLGVVLLVVGVVLFALGLQARRRDRDT